MLVFAEAEERGVRVFQLRMAAFVPVGGIRGSEASEMMLENIGWRLLIEPGVGVDRLTAFPLRQGDLEAVVDTDAGLAGDVYSRRRFNVKDVGNR